MKAVEAIDDIAELQHHPKSWIRCEAKKAIKSLGDYEAKQRRR
jgi:hypothetical protein